MNKLKIFYDKELKKEIDGNIEFNIPAGKDTVKEFYLYNTILYPLVVDIGIIGEDVEMIETVSSIEPKTAKKIKIGFKPKLTRMKPIKATLTIEIEYVIK